MISLLSLVVLFLFVNFNLVIVGQKSSPTTHRPDFRAFPAEREAPLPWLARWLAPWLDCVEEPGTL